MLRLCLKYWTLAAAVEPGGVGWQVLVTFFSNFSLKSNSAVRNIHSTCNLFLIKMKKLDLKRQKDLSAVKAGDGQVLPPAATLSALSCNTPPPKNLTQET